MTRNSKNVRCIMFRRVLYFITPIPLGFILVLIMMLLFGEKGRKHAYFELDNILGSLAQAHLHMAIQVFLYGLIMNLMLGKISKFIMILISTSLGALSGLSVGFIHSDQVLAIGFLAIGAVVGFAIPFLLGGWMKDVTGECPPEKSNPHAKQ